MTLEQLEALGFDESTRDGEGSIRVKCSCCAACVVNGYPIHERGCPNDKHECHGCNNLIPANQKYCEDCK